jgi:hypothetical protein
MATAKHFKKLFGCSLSDFWGYMATDFDGVCRRRCCHVRGFDVMAFAKTFKLRLPAKLAPNAIGKRLLRLVKAKWNKEGVVVVAKLLPPAMLARSRKTV